MPAALTYRKILSWFEIHAHLLAGLFVISFFVSGVLTLSQYGLTWDEGLGNLFFGERYFHFFRTFNPVFLDFKADLPLTSPNSLHLFISPFRNVPYEFPPVADTLAAGCMVLFSYTLRWLNPVDGFHLFTVLLASVFLWYFYRFATARFGKLSAWISLLFLATFPRFWSDMHFNVKDVPETIFFALTMMAFWSWHENPGWGKAVLTGILFACALGVKANAVFILPILIAAILPKSFNPAAWSTFFRQTWKRFPQYAAMGAVALAFYILSWPYLYANPLNNLKGYWGYILSQGGRSGGSAWNLDPILQLVTTMPEFMLLLLGIGLVVVGVRAFKKSSSTWFLLLAWFTVPILRASLPGMVNFNGIRHFLEFVPAAALIAGFGVSQLVSWAGRQRRIGQFWPGAVALLLLAVNLAGIYPRYYPYLHLYYNSLAGGLAGARAGGLTDETVDYWGSSYRQGMDWVRSNAPERARVYAMPANWLLELSAPAFLRPDIEVIDGDLPDFSILEAAERPTYLFFLIHYVPNLDELAYCQQRYAPVFEVIVDSVTILQVFRLGG